MDYVTPGKASEYYGVSTTTLGVWANEGKVEFIKTSGGHRRYKLSKDLPVERRNIIYTRVSSKKQERELQNQIDFLKKEYPNFEVVKDIGSGLNFKRQGFRKILEQLFERNIGEVVIASSDRFSRFGTRDFFEWLFGRFGGTLTILGDKQHESPNEELSEDLLEIITVFSARFYGRRSYSNNKKNKNLPKFRTKKTL